jgi:hypothetical protein
MNLAFPWRIKLPMQGMINRIFEGGNWKRREVRNLEIEQRQPASRPCSVEAEASLATAINAELAEPAEKTGFVLRVLRFLR